MSEIEDIGLGAAYAGGEVGGFVHGVGTAAVTCKADVAALCGSCDADIHAANRLPSRHDRVPVIPFYERAASVVRHRALSSTSSSEEEMKPGRLFVPSVPGCRLFSPHGHQLWIDSTDFRPNHHHHAQCCSLVLQGKINNASSLPFLTSSSSLDFGHYPPKNSQCYSFTGSNASHNQSISPRSPCLDVGVVPSGANISFSEGTADYWASSAAAAGMDREARVLRYREKRKNRKFEKTTRHASRKAYAESRPRIKGRFAKQTESEIEAGRIYSSAVAFLAAGSGFGVVPSL